MTAAQQLTQLVPLLLAKVKGALISEAPSALQIRYSDHMHSPTDPRPKVAKSGRRYYPDANTTNEIRTLYGNISRAVAPKGEGNIFDVRPSKNGLVLESGIDTNVKVETYDGKTVSLLYAAYNEKTRPFFGLGFKEYVEQDYPEAIERILSELEDEYGS